MSFLFKNNFHSIFNNSSITKKKIFCIGRNKTGTTSIAKAFNDLQYKTGNQSKAEKLLPYYKNENFKIIIDYCRNAEAFQDFPFSFPKTYKYLDNAFPNSKFILTIRNDAEEWYNSLINFYAKLFGKGNIPTLKDLQNATYVWKGWIWECNRILYDSPNDDPLNKECLIKHYNNYNLEIKNYFKKRSKDFLVLNIAEKDAYEKFCDFLKINSPYKNFPWENKT